MTLPESELCMNVDEITMEPLVDSYLGHETSEFFYKSPSSTLPTPQPHVPSPQPEVQTSSTISGGDFGEVSVSISMLSQLETASSDTEMLESTPDGDWPSFGTRLSPPLGFPKPHARVPGKIMMASIIYKGKDTDTDTVQVRIEPYDLPFQRYGHPF